MHLGFQGIMMRDLSSRKDVLLEKKAYFHIFLLRIGRAFYQLRSKIIGKIYALRGEY